VTTTHIEHSSVCLSVCLSVCHQSVFCRNVWSDRAIFGMEPVFTKTRYLQKCAYFPLELRLKLWTWCRQRRSTTKLTALAMASLSHLSCAAQLRDAARRADPSASAAVLVVVRQISTKPECGFQFQFQFISLIEPEHQGKNSCTDRCP